MQGKCNCLAVTYARHGTSRVVLSQILDNSSESKEEYKYDESCRVLYLSQDPEHYAIDSIVSSTPDESGLINVLFCLIIVQDLSLKFIAWNLFIDKHFQPLYVLTIRIVDKVGKLLRIQHPNLCCQ